MTALGLGGRVGLRGRLVAFFLVITIAPLTAAIVALQLQVDTQLRTRGEHETETVRSAAMSLVEVERSRVADLADDLVDRLGLALADGTLPPDLADPTAVEAWLDATVGDQVPGRADVVAIVDAEGTPEALRLRQPVLDIDVDLAEQVRRAALGDAPPRASVMEVRELRGVVEGTEELLGWVVTGLWTDRALLERVRIRGGAALVTDGDVLAVTGARAPEVPVGELGPGEATAVEIGGAEMTATVAPLTEAGATQDAVDLVLWTSRASRLGALLIGLLILVPSVALAGALGWLLATTVAAPVRRAADTARAVAAGDLSQTLEPTGGPELADLASALNRMSAELARRLEELSRSRDQLRGSLERLGMTLSSSLDLNRMLAVVVETARDTLVADQALLMLHTPERDALYCKVARGVEHIPPALALDEGLLGHVARSANPALLPGGAETLPRPHPEEPQGASQLAVPLLGRGRVLGVLTLLRDDPEQPFVQSDLDTIRSFSAQASVAIENVLLHQEARRLSVTDPLTGLWNFRYFQLQADRELESAERFERELSLIIVDIDRFKEVNDEHGHQVGDVVLAEVARRIRHATRAPDVVARYGGEEFVVLLPGTGLGGAVAGAERIRESVGRRPVDVRGTQVPVSGEGMDAGPEHLSITCSAGVAAYPRHGRTVATLLRSADVAMYRAKQMGRNRVAAAIDSDAEAADEHGLRHGHGAARRVDGSGARHVGAPPEVSE